MQLTSKLSADNFNCTYTELMKIKYTLELLFVTKTIGDSLEMYAQQYNTRLQLLPEKWANELKCNITDPELLSVIKNVFSSAAVCPS